uniref:Uncharacterized protein n=1 Tax=Nothobranchius furzeri TaxID=105023 RepID=A0A8C6NRG6_NOTFU
EFVLTLLFKCIKSLKFCIINDLTGCRQLIPALQPHPQLHLSSLLWNCLGLTEPVTRSKWRWWHLPFVFKNVLLEAMETQYLHVDAWCRSSRDMLTSFPSKCQL